MRRHRASLSSLHPQTYSSVRIRPSCRGRNFAAFHDCSRQARHTEQECATRREEGEG
jgi:hypothetical protein